MKVSKDQKDEIRKKLIESAIEVMTEKGFQNSTMREISQKAGVGTATIYNYFPTKEKILYSYFLDRQNEVVREIKAIPGFADFTLKEKLQAQIETLLSIYTSDREFVQIAYRMMFDSPLRTFTEITPVREIYTGTAAQFIEDSISRGEMPDHPFRGFINSLYWDYTGLILLYWLKDESEGFSNTTQLIDMSLEIVTGILTSGIIPKAADVLSFLFRSHIYSNVERITGLFNSGREFRDYFSERANGAEQKAGTGKKAKPGRGKNEK